MVVCKLRHMIQVTITYHCHVCQNSLVRNGSNKCGEPQYHCHGGGAYRVLEPKYAYTEQDRIRRSYAIRNQLVCADWNVSSE